MIFFEERSKKYPLKYIFMIYPITMKFHEINYAKVLSVNIATGVVRKEVDKYFKFPENLLLVETL